jgi:2'-5' RNA ligase
VSTARLFVAVWPPTEVVDALRRIARPEHPRLRWTTAEQWHVTLRFLGTTEPQAVEAALATVDLPVVTARLGPALTRLERGVLVAPVGGLDELAEVVVGATAELGRSSERRRFSGHLTMARSGSGTRVPAELAGVAIDAEWAVDDVTLVASHLHPHGARYDILRRFATT